MGLRQNKVTTNEGKKVRIFRKKLDLTQKQMGDKTGKTQTTIQRYESGDYIVPSEFIDALVRELKMSLKWFYNDEGSHLSTLEGTQKKTDLLTSTAKLKDDYTLLREEVNNLKKEFKKLHREMHAMKVQMQSSGH